MTARSSRFQSETEQPIRTPTFTGSAKFNTENQELPKPAPRSSQPVVGSATAKAPVTSTASHSLATKTPPSLTSTTSVAAGKRITNMRQNHGRAVAPPQLPGGLLSGGISVQAHEVDAAKGIDANSIGHQVRVNEQQTVDFSQSPIAQRLMKYSKDYKGSYPTNPCPLDLLVSDSFLQLNVPSPNLVSELNSPCESDSEQGTVLSSSKNSRFQKGRSLERDSSNQLTPNSMNQSSLD